MKQRATLAVLLFLVAATTMAQPVTAGALGRYQGAYSLAAPYTYTDLSHPATADGTLTSVTFRWAGSKTGCSNNVKVKFLRPVNGFQFTVIAERGPFTTAGTLTTVALSPGVPVLAGDLLAITQLQQPGCVGVSYSIGDPDNVLVGMPGDFETGLATTPKITRGYALDARASGDGPVLVGVLAAVGAAAGSNGASFKTDIQIMNADNTFLSGKLVFHPAGRGGTDSDPSISYSLTGVGKILYPNVVSYIGLTGLGSMDVLSTGGITPIVTTRVYNDQGASGTNGFFETMLDPNEALGTYEQAAFQLPADPANFRMNIGVRTLSAGATISVNVVDNVTGIGSGFITKTYAPVYFEQVTASAFTGVASLPANGTVNIEVDSGSAIIYASTTDNRTNDSAITFAKHQ